MPSEGDLSRRHKWLSGHRFAKGERFRAEMESWEKRRIGAL